MSFSCYLTSIYPQTIQLFGCPEESPLEDSNHQYLNLQQIAIINIQNILNFNNKPKKHIYF